MAIKVPESIKCLVSEEPDYLEIRIKFLTELEYKVDCPVCHTKHYLVRTYGGLFCQKKSVQTGLYEHDLNEKLIASGFGEVVQNLAPDS